NAPLTILRGRRCSVNTGGKNWTCGGRRKPYSFSGLKALQLLWIERYGAPEEKSLIFFSKGIACSL
ncbi:hypothetical protein TNCV_3907561, partial [Trichonephila clavipes]